MKTHHHIIAYSALSITIAVLLAVILWPTEQEPLPIDPEVYRTEERMRLRALEVAPLEFKLDSLVKELNDRPYKRFVKRLKIANMRMEMNDSLQASLLHDRIK